jgi:hypothetical protein
MNRAIKCLTDRAGKINEEIKKLEKSMEEPEMMCDIEFGMNDILNLNSELLELEEATKLLLKQ